MSDAVTTNELPEADTETEPSEPTTTETKAEATQPKPTETVDFWKKMARKQEQRAKENDELAQKWRDLTKTVGDKPDYDPRAEIEQLRSEISSEKLERLRVDIARTEGVDPRWVLGTSEEEMRDSATAYKADRDASKSKHVPAATPAAEVTSDKKVEAPNQLTAAEYAALSPVDRKKARDEGRLDSYLRGELR